MSDATTTTRVVRVTLAMLEYVDCDTCRTIGEYRRLGAHHFACKACGSEFLTGPCDCPTRQHAGGKR